MGVSEIPFMTAILLAERVGYILLGFLLGVSITKAIYEFFPKRKGWVVNCISALIIIFLLCIHASLLQASIFLGTIDTGESTVSTDTMQPMHHENSVLAEAISGIEPHVKAETDAIEKRKSRNVISAEKLSTLTANDREAYCVDRYLEELSSVEMKEGDFDDVISRLREGFAEESWVEGDQPIVIAVGSGTTGSSSLAYGLYRLGRDVVHWRWEHLGPMAKEYRNYMYQSHYKSHTEGCNELYKEFDFRIPVAVDAIADTPVAEYFWDYYKTYPNAKFILTTRPAKEWAVRRLKHSGAPAPLQRPCGLKIEDFSQDNNAKLFEAHNNLVRCVVPSERLLELCVLCGNVTYGKLAGFIDLDPAESGLKKNQKLHRYDPSQMYIQMNDGDFLHHYRFLQSQVSVAVCARFTFDYELHYIWGFIAYYFTIGVGHIFLYYDARHYEKHQKTFSKYFRQVESIPFVTIVSDVTNQDEQMLHCVEQVSNAGFTWGIDVDIDEFVIGGPIHLNQTSTAGNDDFWLPDFLKSFPEDEIVIQLRRFNFYTGGHLVQPCGELQIESYTFRKAEPLLGEGKYLFRAEAIEDLLISGKHFGQSSNTAKRVVYPNHDPVDFTNPDWIRYFRQHPETQVLRIHHYFTRSFQECQMKNSYSRTGMNGTGMSGWRGKVGDPYFCHVNHIPSAGVYPPVSLSRDYSAWRLADRVRDNLDKLFQVLPACESRDTLLNQIDEICYALKYPNLLRVHCEGNISNCNPEGLLKHYCNLSPESKKAERKFRCGDLDDGEIDCTQSYRWQP